MNHKTIYENLITSIWVNNEGDFRRSIQIVHHFFEFKRKDCCNFLLQKFDGLS